MRWRATTILRRCIQPNVTVAPAVKSLDHDGLIDAQGVRHELDVVVLATGFHTADYLSKVRIAGREGADLHEAWKGEPAAFLGILRARLPNFFMLYGPNSNSATLIFLLECQAKFAAECLAALARSGKSTVEVKQQPFDAFNRKVQAKLAGSVYRTAKNYYTAPSGRIETQWPCCRSGDE